MPASVDRLAIRALRNTARNKKKGEALVLDIRKRSERMAEDAHAIGTSLRKLSEPSIYHALGYKTFVELVRGEKLMSKSQAYKLMAVADTYTKQQIKELGFEKAYALISYVEATPAPDLAVDLMRANARIGNKYIHSMSVKSLEEAARRVRRATGHSRGQRGPEKLARSTARKLQARLRKSGLKQAKVQAVKREAQWRLSIEVDVSDAGKIA